MTHLGDLRRNINRFLYKHRNKGIPNLMLYISVGSAVVYFLSLFNGASFLYEYLRFDKAAILQGQVWRLFTYVLTYTPGSISLLVPLFLYFFYRLTTHLEAIMGRLRFDLFYFSGMILMAAFAMIFCPTEDVIIGKYIITASDFSIIVYGNMALYLHISIILMFSALNADAHFLVAFVIPVKAWVIGLFELGLLALSIFNNTYPVNLFPHSLFPLVGILNFLLFAGKDVLNLFPFLQNVRRRRPVQKKPTGTVTFRQKETAAPRQTQNFTHRCAVCGRTDVSDPDLEFRYCSRCNGYFCYCEDHISNHTHVE